MHLDPESTVFIDVDTQVDFMEPDGALYVPGAETLKPALKRLVGAARERGARLIASADAHLPGDPEFAQFPPHCIAGTPGQRRVEETEHAGATIVAADGTVTAHGPPTPTGQPVPFDTPALFRNTVLLEKVAFDLFTNPKADEVLAAADARRAVVFGVALDYCVRAAALGLRARGYETVVVSDATLPVAVATGDAARAELEAAGVTFATTDEVIAALAA